MFGVAVLWHAGLKAYTLNSHTIGRHYGKYVLAPRLYELVSPLTITRQALDFGPTWACSCFPFESFYGVLLTLIHGPTAPILQVAG